MSSSHKRTRQRRHRKRHWLLLAPLVLVLGAIGYWTMGQTSSVSTTPPASGVIAYTVVPGDSLTSIAARYGVSTSALMTVNGISNPNLIVSGARLRIPVVSTAPSGVPSDHPDVQRLISMYAQMYGIPATFALAIAWQESGFNQSMVSRTGAIGVMQVEPGTGVTIENSLGGSLNLRDVHDNVRAGVYWLSRLDAMYSGNQRLAAAAYYQGARSVSRDGLYADTTQYVDNVMALQARFGG